MDSRKCQTVTATPAKPGELPVGLEFAPSYPESACDHNPFSGDLIYHG